MLFDDISDQFTGIAKTYTATVEGINTSGVQPGNGILFINGVFQTPTTENNTGQNYIMEHVIKSSNMQSSWINVEQKSKKAVSQKIESDTNCNVLIRYKSRYPSISLHQCIWLVI